MKKLIVFALVIVSILPGVKAQRLITVQNGGTPAFYTMLDSAVANAQNGDTIYIPGGGFSLSFPIDKSIHIIGVGHNPDSSSATFYTFITTDIYLITGADNGSLTGVYLNGSILFGTSATNANVSNYTVKRNNFYYVSSYANTPSNNFFVENVVRSDVYLNSVNGNAFYSNIIGGDVRNGENSEFKNNIFLSNSHLGYGSVLNSVFKNNIFIGTVPIQSDVSGCLFYNNIFIANYSFPYVTNSGSNNIVNQVSTSIFVNQTGDSFNYSHDYHLKSTCPGKNAGTDGTDIGIYGGAFPWKDGSVPFNPHIQLKSISENTNATGNLNVNIKVAAQDR